jgi:hypothetical protein
MLSFRPARGSEKSHRAPPRPRCSRSFCRDRWFGNKGSGVWRGAGNAHDSTACASRMAAHHSGTPWAWFGGSRGSEFSLAETTAQPSARDAFLGARFSLETRVKDNHSRHGAWMKRLCRTAGRQSFGVRSLETAFPLPLFLFQSGVEQPQSKAFGSGGCHGAAPTSLKPPSPPREPTMPPGFDRPTRRSALQGAVATPGGTGSARSVFASLDGRRGGRPSRARSQRLEGPAPPGPSSFPAAADACLPCRHRQAEAGALKRFT